MAKKITNRMYQLYELRDSLQDAIENVSALLVQQKHLVQIVTSSKYAEEMKDFTKGVTLDNKNYEAKLTSYRERLEKIKGIIELYERRDTQSIFVVKIVTDLIEALNLGVDDTTPKNPDNTNA